MYLKGVPTAVPLMSAEPFSVFELIVLLLCSCFPQESSDESTVREQHSTEQQAHIVTNWWT